MLCLLFLLIQNLNFSGGNYAFCRSWWFTSFSRNDLAYYHCHSNWIVNGEKVIWALVNFFCQPLGGIIFYVMKKQGLIPLILVIIGAILLGIR